MNVFDITLDVDKRDNRESITIRQGDINGTTVNASLRDHGVPMSDGTYDARFCMSLPDRKTFYSTEATYDAGVVSAVIDERYAASVAGATNNAYFELYENEELKYTTASFIVRIKPSALENNTIAHSYDSRVEEVIEELNEAMERCVPPTVTIEEGEGTHTVTVTTALDESTFTVLDGRTGDGAPSVTLSCEVHLVDSKSDGTCASDDGETFQVLFDGWVGTERVAADAGTIDAPEGITASVTRQATADTSGVIDFAVSGEWADADSFVYVPFDVGGSTVTKSVTVTRRLRGDAADPGSIGMSMLSDEVRNRIASYHLYGTLTTDSRSASDSLGAPPVSMSMSGVSTQGVAPTPDAPTRIAGVGPVVLHANNDVTQGWPLSIDLQGHTLYGLPNGIADELVVDESHTAYVIKRVGHVGLGSLTWAKTETRTGGMSRYFTTGLRSVAVHAASDTTAGGIMSDGFRAVSYNETYNRVEDSIAISTEGIVSIYDTEYSGSLKTPEDFRAMVGGLSAIYALSQPYVVEIGPVTLPALPSVSVSLTCNAPFVVAYERDIRLVIEAIEARLP